MRTLRAAIILQKPLLLLLT